MNNKLNWGDYEVVLGIAEAGSLSKAARMCGSSHPTVFRKINEVEKKLGVRLFDRHRSGYRPTPAGEEIAAAARQIATLTNEAERRVAGRDLRPSGQVRLATTDSLLCGLLALEITRFRQEHEAIILDVVMSNNVEDLSRRDADVAIRPANAPEEQLIGRQLGVIEQAIYAPTTMIHDPGTQSDWDSLAWISPSTTMPYGLLNAWMRANINEARWVCRMDSVLGMHAAVRAGIGVAILPQYLAESDPALRRIGEPIEALATPLWMLTHPDLKNTARVRAVLDFFADRLGGQF